MTSTEEESLETAISQYELQLSQVECAMTAATTEEERAGLSSLISDISELIRLTQENLLGVKKQKLLSTLPVAPQDALDEEYLLFKAELGEDPMDHIKMKVEKPDIGSDLQALAGMKCQAPYKQQYGSDVSYHNAMVSSVDVNSTEGATQTSDIQVRVIFVNPTQQSMRLCPYYLDGKCRFEETKCRYSHGELVPLSELREYQEPDFSSLHKGSRVLARGTAELWHCATVTDVETSGAGTEHQQDVCHVKFESTGEEAIIEMQSVLPLEDESSSDESSDDEMIARQEEEETLEIANTILMNQGPSIALGAWEIHTKGIGSMLMARMGYITGTGLGKNAEGKVEPVEAIVLPPGKSLDHCMHLKEISGDKNLFKAERRHRRQQKKLERKRQEKYKRDKAKKKTGTVFDFINSYLTPSGPSTSKLPTVARDNKSSAPSTSLKEDSRHGLNVRTLKVSEDIKRAEKDLLSIKQSLARQGKSKTPTSKSLQAKLDAKQSELDLLRKEEKNVNTEKNRRENRHKMVHF